VETVLLDAGGVLLDLDYAYIRRLLEARDVQATLETLSSAEAIARCEIDRRVRDGGTSAEAWRDYFRVILGRVGLAAVHHDAIIETLWEAHQRVGLWTIPLPGALETVRQLRDMGFRIGVVSNAEGRVQQDLEAAGFDNVFETVVDSHLVGVAKPDPGIFRIALERMRAKPEAAVFLGDVPAVDVPGAAALGIAPLILDRHGLYPELTVPRLRAITSFPAWVNGDDEPTAHSRT
jgi:putative hydrolase of the HAD superfamily